MTVKALIEAAYARSTFNDPDKLATDKELAAVVNRRLMELFSIGASQNPFYFGKKSGAVAYDAGVTGWPRPVDAEMVIQVTGSTVGKVSVVPFEDQEANLAPRLYAFGQVYFSVGADVPTTDTLTFHYSKRPAEITAATDPVDTMWPEQFNDLIVLDVAQYLAIKDQRPDEAALLKGEEADLFQAFIRHLSHENYAMVARWGHRARVVGQGVSPVGTKE